MARSSSGCEISAYGRASRGVRSIITYSRKLYNIKNICLYFGHILKRVPLRPQIGRVFLHQQEKKLSGQLGETDTAFKSPLFGWRLLCRMTPFPESNLKNPAQETARKSVNISMQQKEISIFFRRKNNLYFFKQICTLNMYCLIPGNCKISVQIIDWKKYKCYTDISFNPSA